MSAIYQQARPNTFKQVIGQEHVKEVLLAAISKERVGHAYLFSGPRGVGKTTMARLLAMAVNCGAAINNKPCGECESCQLVRQGSHPDIIELDAASNNSVDDIRDLREKVNLASIRGGTRVWILDEAHMLTKSAANALLKTLEEPPAKLMFILATTEPEKLPATILSRCQHYRFSRLSEGEIALKLKHLCQQANVSAEEEALSLVARAADGAMRDGESLLEKLLTTETHISKPIAEKALGLPPQSRLQALAKYLAKGSLAELFKEATELYNDGFAPRSLYDRLKLTLRDALYAKLGLVGYNFKLDISENELLRLIHALDNEAERFVRYDDLFSLEVALIKALNALKNNLPTTSSITNAQTKVTGTTVVPNFNPTASRHADELQATRPQATRPQATRQQRVEPSSTKPSLTPKKPERSASWHDFLRQVNSPIKAFLIPASPPKIEGKNIYLNFPDTYNFHFEQLKLRETEFTKFVTKVFGDGYTIYMKSSKGNHTIKIGVVKGKATNKTTSETTNDNEFIDKPSIEKDGSIAALLEVEQVNNETPLTSPLSIPSSTNNQLTKEIVSETVSTKKHLVELTTQETPTQETPTQETPTQDASVQKAPTQEVKNKLETTPLENPVTGEEYLPPDFWDNAPATPATSETVNNNPKPTNKMTDLSVTQEEASDQEITRVLKLFPGKVTFTPKNTSH